MFQLTKDEFDNLKCQSGISSWGGKRKLSYAFTEPNILLTKYDTISTKEKV